MLVGLFDAEGCNCNQFAPSPRIVSMGGSVSAFYKQHAIQYRED